MRAAHGESVRYFDFPLPKVDAMSACTMRSYPRHTHDQYGIGVIDDGGHSSWSGRGQVEAGPGRMICCNPGEVTDGRPVGGRKRSWRMMYLDPAVISRFWSDVHDDEPAEFTFSRPVFFSEDTRVLFDRTFAHAGSASNPDETMQAESALIALVASLSVNTTAHRIERDGAVGSIRRAKERIDSDPAAALTLSDLASETGLSCHQLIRAFSKSVGLTPHAYIVQRRIHLATRLIRDRYSLAEAALLAGFYDQAHLTRCFVRQFGVTPRRYALRTSQKQLLRF